MIFQELTLLNFGKFQNKKFIFRPGINLVHGRNETGKTTLFQAIFGILFGFKNDRERYLPWQRADHYAARLLIENDLHRIQLERDFTDDKVAFVQKDLKTNQVSSFHGRVSPLGRSSEREVYIRKLHELFGFSEPDAFKHSLFIEQRSLPELPSASTTVELKSLISNISDFNYDQIIKRIEERYFEMTKKNPKGIDKRNNRLLENIQCRIKECEIDLHKAYEEEQRLCSLSREISEIKEKLSLKEQKFKKLSASIDALRQIGKVSKKESEVRKIFSDLQKKKALVERLLSQQKEIEKEKPELGRGFAFILICGGLLLPLLAMTTRIGWFWLLFLFFGLLGYSIKNFMKFRSEAQQFALRDLRLKSQLEVLPELKELTENYFQEEKTLHEIGYQKNELEKNIAGLNHPQNFMPEALSRLILDKESEKEVLESEIRKLQENYHAKRQHYIFSSRGLQSPFTLEEELYDLKEHAKHLKMKTEALLTAKDILSQMIVEFRKEHIHVFAGESNRLFKDIVDGSHPAIKTFSFEEDDFSPVFKWDGKTIPFGALSCGTQDQIYFAIKLSLLHLVDGGTRGSKHLPLFLDDPFVNFDHERRKRVLPLLKKISTSHQLFLFTYDPWYIEELKNDAHLISMEGDGEKEGEEKTA
jgi:DNA repair exonuclease SbcCD ATPase subunit